jgi:CRP/FNR family transcriptional regulator
MKDYCRGCPVLQTSFFAALKGSMKGLLACLFVYGRYARRQVLFQEGNPAIRVFALKSGWVKTYRGEPGGRQQIIELIGPGGVFGLDGLGSEQYSVSAEALCPSEVCFFEKDRFLELAAANPALSVELIRILSLALAGYHQRLTSLGTKPAQARLAALLLGLLPDGGGRASADLPLSRGELAGFVGVRLETLSRLLLDLRRRRVLSLDGRRLVVHDSHRLRDLAR